MDISQVPDDVLLDIFFLNTNIFLSEDCIRSTLSSSQVCSRWRDLLLSTPSIWGHLISTREFRTLGDEGKYRILSRSNTAPLWISHIDGFDPNGMSESLLTWIIASNWERIEHLYISIPLLKASQFQLESVLERPAPYLRSFYFVDSNAAHPQQEQGIHFFGDIAPSLRSFTAMRLPSNLSVKWLPQLTHLALIHHPALSKVLTCLRSTPQLESLYVEGLPYASVREDPSKSPAVLLPKLNRVQIGNLDIQNCTVLLRNIRPAKGCSLQFCPPIRYRRNSDDHLVFWAGEAIPLLSAHLEGFLQVHKGNVRSTGLRLGLKSFTFDCGRGTDVKPENSTESTVASQIGFLVSIWGETDRVFSEATHALLRSLFSKYNWSSVTKLTLDIKLISPSVDRLTADNLMSFSSVTHLSIQVGTFSTLLELTTKDFYSERPVFPLLHTVTVFPCRQRVHPPSPAGAPPDPAVRFLEYRESIGFPVRKLICTQVESDHLNLGILVGKTEVVHIGGDEMATMMNTNNVVIR